MPDSPGISVAIPTYGREKELVDTVRSLLDRQTFKNFELLVVDQSPRHTPGTDLFLQSISDARFRYFRTTPPSVPMAKNFALKNARSPYMIFLDDDIIPDPQLIGIYVDTFSEMPHVSAIAGRVLQDGFPIKKNVLKFDQYAESHGVFTATEPGYTNAFPGGNCAVRIKEALDLGGFDTRYKDNSFREENDLSIRMARSGHLIFFQPRSRIFHLSAPYGGCRVRENLPDNAGFYRNELFFTLRFSDKHLRMKALYKKFNHYCLSGEHKLLKRRVLFFCLGICAALWRIMFEKQREARLLHAGLKPNPMTVPNRIHHPNAQGS